MTDLPERPASRKSATIKSNVVEDLDITEPGGAVKAVFVNTSPTRGWMAQIITLR
jgi:hypothetical protein